MHSLAECNIPADTEWSHGNTNLMRCGVPGFLTNCTYYLTAIEQEWNNRDVLDGANGSSLGIAAYYTYRRTDYLPSITNNCISQLCSNTQSNYGYINIPFPYDAKTGKLCNGSEIRIYAPCSCETGGDCTNCGSYYSPESGLGDSDCLSLFSNFFTSWNHYHYPQYSAGWGYVGSTNILDNYQLIEHDYQWGEYGAAADLAGMETNITLAMYSNPITIQEFAGFAIAAARNNWVDVGIADSGEASTTFSNERSCTTVQTLRYRLRFQSQMGVRYKATWDIRIVVAGQYTNIISGQSWTGYGNGAVKVTDCMFFPILRSMKHTQLQSSM